MKVVVLMGGYGTRMRPHSWSRPKPVLQVGHNTVIGHILDSMAAVATEEVILVVGYKGEQIERWVREHYGHLALRFVYQDEPLGQAHALWLCRELLDEGDERGIERRPGEDGTAGEVDEPVPLRERDRTLPEGPAVGGEGDPARVLHENEQRGGRSRRKGREERGALTVRIRHVAATPLVRAPAASAVRPRPA